MAGLDPIETASRDEIAALQQERTELSGRLVEERKVFTRVIQEQTVAYHHPGTQSQGAYPRRAGRTGRHLRRHHRTL